MCFFPPSEFIGRVLILGCREDENDDKIGNAYQKSDENEFAILLDHNLSLW